MSSPGSYLKFLLLFLFLIITYIKCFSAKIGITTWCLTIWLVGVIIKIAQMILGSFYSSIRIKPWLLRLYLICTFDLYIFISTSFWIVKVIWSNRKFMPSLCLFTFYSIGTRVLVLNLVYIFGRVITIINHYATILFLWLKTSFFIETIFKIYPILSCILLLLLLKPIRGVLILTDYI